MTTTLLVRLLMLLCAVCSPAFAAETPRQLAWEDLTFRLPAAENPFANLSIEQLEALADGGRASVMQCVEVAARGAVGRGGRGQPEGGRCAADGARDRDGA